MFKYLCLVANPPLMCRSALFSSSTSLTCAASIGLNADKRSVISLCTVDFEIPKYFAALRTVDFLSIMYSASLTVLSSIWCFN